MDYVLHLAALISLYGILALSLDLMLGLGGMMNLATAAYIGFGSYTYALATTRFMAPPLVAAAISIIATSAIACALSILLTKCSRETFVLATISIQMIFYSAVYNLEATNGSNGISGIPPLAIGSITTMSPVSFTSLCAFCLCLMFGLRHKLASSPFSLGLRALRDDDVAAANLLIRSNRVQPAVTALAAGAGSMVGILIAASSGYIDPTSFVLSESLFVLSCVALGGFESGAGAVVGTLILVILPDCLSLLSVDSNAIFHVRQCLSGILLLSVLRFRPAGLLGSTRGLE